MRLIDECREDEERRSIMYENNDSFTGDANSVTHNNNHY